MRDATVVQVRAGMDVELHDFVIPNQLSFVEVAGWVLDSAGAPAVGARVFLAGPHEGDPILGEPAVTDASGQFVLSATAGAEYRLFAERNRPGSRSGQMDATEVISVVASIDRTTRTLRLRALH